jgi:serine/threonine protein kinase
MIIDTNQLLGKTLGNCVLERLIGQGGMGAVYLAQQTRPRRTVAVKVLLPELTPKSARISTEFLARFRREADAIATLDHVNIMPIYEYGEQEQLAYLVMPHVTGGTLRNRLVAQRALPLSEVIPIVEQAAAALDYAHAHGIVHRDLKPANMLFHADGRLLLTDFGIAKMMNETTPLDATALHTLTTTGTIIGTPEYLSPEQATGGSIDRRSDVYSLGIVVFHLLTGQVPFLGPTPVAIALKHAMEEPPSLTHLNPALPKSVEQVLRKAIAKRPEERYATAGDFAHALAAASHVQSAAFFSEQTVQNKNLVPVVLMSEKKSTAVPRTLHNEAVPISSQPAFHTPEEVGVPLTVPPPRSLQQRRRRFTGGMLLLSGLLVLLLVLGSAAFSLHWLPGQSPAPTTGATEHQISKAGLPPSSTSTLPPPSVSAGRLLYSSLRPTCNLQQASVWNADATAHVTCNPAAMTLTTSGGANSGVFLSSLPTGAPIPDNYVLQVQVKEHPSSQGAFGIVFRAQPGPDHKGAFAFLIHPSGNWVGNIYNDATGQANQLYGRQGHALSANGFTTIAIVVHGSSFSLYFDGVAQGGIESPNYPGGILGLVAEPGTEVQFKNMAIYALP